MRDEKERLKKGSIEPGFKACRIRTHDELNSVKGAVLAVTKSG